MKLMLNMLRAAFLVFFTAAPPAIASDFLTAFSKSDPFSVAFYKSGSGIFLEGGTAIAWPGGGCAFTIDVAVVLPVLSPGTDYEIRVRPDCSLYARSYSEAPVAGSKAVGGFHYLPGGYPNNYNLGGNSAPEILHWSLWDAAFRPACPNPRGMTKVGNAPIWVDIYFLGDSSNVDGVSRNNDTILTGTNPPVRASDYGGNGIAKYGNLNWWTANEFVAQWGKRLPSYKEMVLAAFGAQEGKGRGNHPVKTGLETANAALRWPDSRFTSKFGLIQATGVIWIWTGDFSDWEGAPATGAYGWDPYNVAEGRGQLILQNSDDLTALLFGGKWNYEEINGTRTTETIEKLWDNSANIGIRGACDHYFQY